MRTTGVERTLMVCAFVDSLGTGLFYASSALFFTLYVGVPVRVVGLGLMVAGLCGLAATVPIARLADRYDAVRTLAAIQVVRGLLFASYLSVGTVAGFFLVACLLGCVQRPVAPITQSVVVRVSPGTRRIEALARMRVVRNVGLGLGALAASAGLASGHRATFVGLLLGNAVSFFVAAALLVGINGRLRRDLSDRAAPPPTRKGLSAVRDAPYMGAALCNGALALHQSAIEVGIPLWIVHSHAAPTFVPAALIAGNTVLVIALQVRLARGAREVGGAKRYVTASGVGLAVFSLLMAATGFVHANAAIACLAAGVVALSLGEMWQSSSNWFVGNEYADPSRRSEYLASFSLGTTVQSIVGPAVFSALVVPAGGAGWVVLGVLFLGAGIAYRSVVTHLDRRSAGAQQCALAGELA